MRLWSIHPEYLDPQGLVALWRETLLAQKVLAGLTRGYRSHPQLIRFRSHPDPMAAIATYLCSIADEADLRGYRFDRSKIGASRTPLTLPVNDGQLEYELAHLRAKLELRNPLVLATLATVGVPRPHPLFTVVSGPVELWERPGSSTRGR